MVAQDLSFDLLYLGIGLSIEMIVVFAKCFFQSTDPATKLKIALLSFCNYRLLYSTLWVCMFRDLQYLLDQVMLAVPLAYAGFLNLEGGGEDRRKF